MSIHTQFAIGSHLKVARLGYFHHGIYIGNGQVIHYAGFCDTFKSAPVTCVSLSQFQGSADKILIVQHDSHKIQYSRQEIIERAKSRLGEDNYNLFTNNCEHFANWCITGKAVSKQINRVKHLCAGLLTTSIALFATISHAKEWFAIL